MSNWRKLAFTDNPVFTGIVEAPAIKLTTGAGLNKVLTSDADGDATWQTAGTGSVNYSKSFVMSSPTINADSPVWRAPVGITITAVHVLCIGGTSITGHLWIYDANGLNGNSVDSTDIVAGVGVNQNDDGALSNPTVTAGFYVGWVTSGIAGTVTRTIVTFEYTITP